MRRQSILILVMVLSVISLLSADAPADKLPDLYTLGWLNEFSPAELHPGDMLNIDYLVANNGTMCIPEFPCEEMFGPAYGPWQEAVFLSKNGYPDTGDILLGTVTFEGVLSPHGAHEVQRQFQVPLDCPPDNYKVIVYADYIAGQQSGQIEETEETNNWGACTGTLKVMSLLKVLDPDGGGALVAGSTYTIRWTDFRSDGNCPGDYLLDYSADNGQNWIPVAPNTVSNTCSYDWLVPMVNSNQCLVRISDADDESIYDTSDDAFRIYICTLAYDLNQDCFVDFQDFSLLVSEWLNCGDPCDPTCQP